MRYSDLTSWLAMTRDPDAATRREAVSHLCPCRVKANDARVWDRLIEMLADPDPRVRSWVFHNLCDGSPREREREIVAALEARSNDEDRRLRRRIRQLLAAYRRTGNLNLL